ncbi:FAD-dependent oxidoreductase [Streptomyces sp. NBC_01381]|uniref:FAD-dependent oxidoreductase n=1 Tax=Streptomyces sp. NBC_01381 TaxID=2903845 RepID=UPI00224EC011|nr:FAD-dependent oxidoreductase [Streptomyces sp. NBC_01381]MCX4669452.1 FAD-dependent oxidoreductase [Streptomyces sp. NBC_01381]
MALNSVKETPLTVDVLIVGAGPTGLTLACDLARRGVRALVVERADALFPGSRGKGIQPRTQEVFDDLGIIDAALAAGGPAPVGMVWQGGERQGEHRMFDATEATPDAPYASPLLLPQWRTQEILSARLHELGGRDVEFGAELSGLTQDGEGVTAHLSDGRTVRAAYAVAADGGRSTVRAALGIGMTGETVDPHPILVADVRIPALDRDNWHMFAPTADGTGFLAICPLPGTQDFQLTAQFTDGTAPDTSLDGVRAVVAARTHLAADDVTEVRWASDFRPRAAMANRFRDGRVFLAGDAAHVHSPAGGQGLNTSVQDAYNLGWKLGAVLRGGAPEALLDTYEEERLPNAAQMLGLSTRIHRGEERRGAATRQLGLGYRDSSLTAETRTGLAEGALRAGDRAPDGPYAGRRLFDAFRGPHFTLLTVGTDAELPLLDDELVHTCRIDAYPPYGKGLFLVRPDGYVGWAGEDTTGLTDYFRLIHQGS